jgi:general stress protein 26
MTWDEIAPEFAHRTRRAILCTAATVDARGRPRSRILHPLWEDRRGWILTGRQSTKSRHLTRHPYVSLTYWDNEQEQVHVDCQVAWRDDLPTRRRLWELFRTTPPPAGYDPSPFFPGGPEDSGFGCLELVPWRIELWSTADLLSGRPPRVWRPGTA